MQSFRSNLNRNLRLPLLRDACASRVSSILHPVHPVPCAASVYAEQKRQDDETYMSSTPSVPRPGSRISGNMQTVIELMP